MSSFVRKKNEFNKADCSYRTGLCGVPLAIEFAEKIKLIGFDTNEGHLADFNPIEDRTNEANLDDLRLALAFGNISAGLKLSAQPGDENLYHLY